VRIRYVLVPLHPVDRVEFRGSVGPARARPAAAGDGSFRHGALVADVRTWPTRCGAFYRERGFPEARISRHRGDARARIAPRSCCTIESGPGPDRPAVSVQQIDPEHRRAAASGVRVGQPYDGPADRPQLDAWVDRLRAGLLRGACQSIRVVRSRTASRRMSVMTAVERGPRVVVAFSGDPLPAGERNRLVPCGAEGSADEDLLEDAVLAPSANTCSPRATATPRSRYTRTETPGS
jgi:hypothetical protein